MSDSSEIYVIGHRNPDTDSICAAIGYAHFLEKVKGQRAVPACCGSLNPRTQYVLEQAGLSAPKLLMDVQPRAGDVCNRNVLSAKPHEAFHSVYRRMQKHKVRGLPVVNRDGLLEGILTLSSLLDLLLPEGNYSLEDPRRVTTNMRRIAVILADRAAAQAAEDREEDFLLVVGAMSTESFSSRLKEYPKNRVILIVGNRQSIQLLAIDYGVRVLVITNGYPLSPEFEERARENHVTVIHSSHDTATTTLLIRGSSSLDPAVEQKFLSFNESDSLSLVRKQVYRSDQDLFPVVDDQNRLTGVFTKSDLLDPPRRKLVLVDHNEPDQAVEGIHEAEVLEVVDHHRMGGGLVTAEPIRFINDPVGSTCTMIARFMKEAGYTPPAGVAMCLSAGIIADTLLLSSPTTTSVDREMLEWASGIGGINAAAFARAFFATGSVLEQMNSSEALESDCKQYGENDWVFTVSQIEEVGQERFLEHKASLAEGLEKMVKARQLDFACVMMTDISRQNSMLLVAGEEVLPLLAGFPRLEKDLFQMPGVVSRKKQLLPYLSRILAQQHKGR